MGKTIALPITCSCKEEKKFKYTVQLAEKHNAATATTIQVDCPFPYETHCVKRLTIKLPPGIQIKNDENIFRG